MFPKKYSWQRRCMKAMKTFLAYFTDFYCTAVNPASKNAERHFLLTSASTSPHYCD